MPHRQHRPSLRAAASGRNEFRVPEIVTLNSNNAGEFLQRHERGGLPWPAYLRTMSQPWIDHRRPYAYVLLDERRCVGWMQTIYALVPIRGRNELICNLSGWWVDEPYRTGSMAIMVAAIRDARDVAITALTPSGDATRIYDMLRFARLDVERWALPVHGRGSSTKVHTDPEEIFLRLSPADKAIFNDHRGLALNHFLIEDGSRYCYFPYLTRMRFEQVADVLYFGGVSDLVLGSWAAPAGCPLAECASLLIDKRFLAAPDLDLPLQNPFNPRFYRGPADLRADLSFMYSEIPLYSASLI